MDINYLQGTIAQDGGNKFRAVAHGIKRELSPAIGHVQNLITSAQIAFKKLSIYGFNFKDNGIYSTQEKMIIFTGIVIAAFIIFDALYLLIRGSFRKQGKHEEQRIVGDEIIRDNVEREDNKNHLVEIEVADEVPSIPVNVGNNINDNKNDDVALKVPVVNDRATVRKESFAALRSKFSSAKNKSDELMPTKYKLRPRTSKVNKKYMTLPPPKQSHASYHQSDDSVKQMRSVVKSTKAFKQRSNVYRDLAAGTRPKSFDKMQFMHRLDSIYSGSQSNMSIKPTLTKKKKKTHKWSMHDDSASASGIFTLDGDDHDRDDSTEVGNNFDDLSVMTSASMNFQINNDDPMKRYKKMLKFGIPITGVLREMTKDGIDNPSAEMLGLSLSSSNEDRPAGLDKLVMNVPIRPSDNMISANLRKTKNNTMRSFQHSNQSVASGELISELKGKLSERHMLRNRRSKRNDVNINSTMSTAEIQAEKDL